MNSSINIYLILLFSVFFVFDLSFGRPRADSDDDSIVPEDIEDGSILDELEPTKQTRPNPKWSPSAIEEYLQEHPEVKQMPTSGGNGEGVRMKRVYNKFGDVVSIPDTSAPKVEPPKPPNGGQMAPFPYPFYNPYLYNPYMNQFGVFAQNQAMAQQPPPLPGSPVTPQELAKFQLKPRTGSEDQIKSETEVNQKFLSLIQSQQTAANNNNNNNGTVRPQFAPFPPPPFFPQFQPFLNPSQYQIDNKNVKVMPFPVGPQLDPNLLKQLQSGAAQLDLANTRILPMDMSPSSEKTPQGTESESLDDRPELPEVVFPKTTPPPETPPPKTVSKRPKQRRHFRHKSRGVRKPHFLMRARLNNLPKKNQQGGDQWWTKPVPPYCQEEIVEITSCKDKHLEKRWSFNESDEKCYLYEDLCYKMKKNTFKSLKDCMTICWRPK